MLGFLGYVACVSWRELSEWRFYAELFNVGNGFVCFYWASVGLLLASVHYMLLRGKGARARELGVMAVIALVVVGLGVKAEKERRTYARLSNAIYADRLRDSEELTVLYEAGDYVGLMAEMERRCAVYDAAVEELKDWDPEMLEDRLKIRRAPRHGASALFVHMQDLGDVHSKALPVDVEWFLYETVWDTNYYDQNPRNPDDPWQSVAKLMVESDHLVLRGLGLWFFGDFEAYRDFVYQKVDEGDERFLGMAAHAATRYDKDEKRVLKRMVDISRMMALRPGEEIAKSSVMGGMVLAAQKVFELGEDAGDLSQVNAALDELLLTKMVEEHPGVIELYKKMGRDADSEKYKERVAKNKSEDLKKRSKLMQR
ncbi:hypothetical protein [Rubritalea halochordaticola]